MTEDRQPIASVIVLGYNDKKYLEGCLGSLVDQDMPREDYEVIYADNASSDGSVEYVAEHFPDVKILCLDKNYGFAEGNNRAVALARGRYIAFQNDDTVAHRRWLPELIAGMGYAPQVKACHPAGRPLRLGGYHEREAPIDVGVMCELTRYGYIDFTETQLQQASPKPTLHIAGGSFLIDREILNELKYCFDPSFFMYNEDTDLGLRINNLGYTVLFVPSALMYHERAPERRTVLNKKGVRMAFLATRNRFIAFYKNMTAVEFVLALPLILMGSVVKLRTLPLRPLRRLVYAFALIPFTLIALGWAMSRFPSYARERRYILDHRRRGYLWLLKELWIRKPPPWTYLYAGGGDGSPAPVSAV